MPPSRGAMAGGTMVRGIRQRETKLEDDLASVGTGAENLAQNVGMEDDSVLGKEAHQKLAALVQQLAAENAKLEMKKVATISALMALASEMDKKAYKGPGARAGPAEPEPSPEQMDMSYFLEDMKSKVSSAMQEADQKALERKSYKDIMKKIMAPDMSDDDDIIVPHNETVSLKCPLTSSTFVEPVKSKACGHTYSKTAIWNHIRVGGKNGAAASCPVAGCLHKVGRADLVPDKDMMRRLRIESNTQHTESPQDAEEVDDEEGSLDFGTSYL